ncbi:riboflavin synthase [Roseomonas sp. GC11]|uniref:riboflavin synthase n=1 Tax=Roseomonas sp. GC11 TaxID=2950546 RepID=UPI00210A7531|nr:riboflavin synthase [Roseomonas sp. GC11]MCQ4158964.1 riboflavin synthase [Roseomonas sp. GC11]
MFTGIITAKGEVAAVAPIGGGQDMRLVIATPEGWLEGAAIGASIACSGCCLTVITREADRFTVEVSAETLGKTTLGAWRPGAAINLERALRMGDELGGHVVSGHVDGVGEVVSATPENGSLRLTVRLPAALARFVAPKGSVTIEGVSLTVNAVEGTAFGVNLIPHTAQVTTLGGLAAGDRVNIEIDMLARYVARLREFEVGEHSA